MSDRTETARREDGARVVRQMFGQEFLDRNMGALAHRDDAVGAMGRFALEQCYGDVWTRPGLSLRERSLVTLGMLIAAGHPDEIGNHVLGARGNGLTREELLELVVQSAPYVGFPAAGQAMNVVLRTWPEDDEPGTPSAVELLRQVFADPDLTTGDPVSVPWHQDVVYYGMGADGVDREFRGQAALGGLLADTRAVMDEMVDTLVAVHPIGDDIAVGHVHAHRRAARTGETVDDSYVMVVEVADGAIVRGHDVASATYREFFRKQFAAAN